MSAFQIWVLKIRDTGTMGRQQSGHGSGFCQQGIESIGSRHPCVKDYHCPFRRTAVLLKDRVYDPPLYLARIGFPRNTGLTGFGGSGDYLNRILAGLTRDDSEDWKRIENAYRDLMGAVEKKLVFEFHSHAEAIFLDGKALISGVPAKIMKKILMAAGEGRTDFDFLIFKHDREIFPDSKRSSFETRWNRLRDKLAEATTHARLEKTGKGEFSFKADCPTEFRQVV